ncbi:MAG: secretin N-terminal domain-containing protein [bacterium]|nr:secretin N-terminal domain-containing protein [bacterium]
MALLLFFDAAMAQQGPTNFRQISLETAIELIASETGKRFVFDAEKIKNKKVTILAETSPTGQELYRLLDAILEANDLSAIEESGAVKIVPSSNIKQDSGRVVLEPKDPSQHYVTRVIQVRYVEAKALRNSLSPILSRHAVLVVEDSSNTMVIKDHRDSAERFAKIVEALDQPDNQFKESQLAVIELKNASAKDAESMLNRVFEQHNNRGKRLKVVGDQRTNSLVLIGFPDGIELARSLLKKLDQENKAQGGNMRVYPLKNANATQVSKVLERFRPGNQPNQLQVIADVPSNSVVVFSDSGDFTAIENVIEQLDVVRAQVFIQALIMEIKLDKSLDLGVEWQAGQATTVAGQDAFVTAGGVGSTGGARSFPATTTGGAAIGVLGGPITFGDQTFSSFNAFIKATQQDTEIDILSNPQILTLNNEEAEIKVGEIVPTLGSTKVDPQGNQTTLIEYKEVGVGLKISPQINADNTIELKIDQNSSNLVQGQTNNLNQQGAITMLNRALKTKVVVDDGQTIVLGGLISDEISDVEVKTPCLGDIPILGWFFKTRKSTVRKTNLLVFLTPKVVRSPEELAQVSRSAKLKLKSARQGRFRVDVTKEYKIPVVPGGQDPGMTPDGRTPSSLRRD